MKGHHPKVYCSKEEQSQLNWDLKFLMNLRWILLKLWNYFKNLGDTILHNAIHGTKCSWKEEEEGWSCALKLRKDTIWNQFIMVASKWFARPFSFLDTKSGLFIAVKMCKYCQNCETALTGQRQAWLKERFGLVLIGLGWFQKWLSSQAGTKCIFAKCTRITHLLSFPSLLLYYPFQNFSFSRI